MSEVWDLDLPRDLKIVALALADHADDFGGNVRPSIDRVAKKCGYSRSSIDRKMKELRDIGLLVVVSRPANKPVEYRMDLGVCVKLVYTTRDVESTPPVTHRSTSPVTYKPSVEPSENHQVDMPGIYRTEISAEQMAGTYVTVPPRPDPNGPYTDDFEKLWRIHSRGGKRTAFKAYLKAARKITHAELETFLRGYVGQLNNGFRGAHLSTWLNGEQWHETLEGHPQHDLDNWAERERQRIAGLARA